jgi:hemerythrin
VHLEGDAVSDPGWDPSLETGDEPVDDQHREVFAMLRDFEASDSNELGVVLGMADRIMAHVEVHFTMEEDLMRTWSYPGPAFAEHAAKHEALKERARSTVLDLRAGRSTGSAPLIDYLRSGLAEHIVDQDRPMVAHIRERRADVSPE